MQVLKSFPFRNKIYRPEKIGDYFLLLSIRCRNLQLFKEKGELCRHDFLKEQMLAVVYVGTF